MKFKIANVPQIDILVGDNLVTKESELGKIIIEKIFQNISTSWSTATLYVKTNPFWLNFGYYPCKYKSEDENGILFECNLGEFHLTHKCITKNKIKSIFYFKIKNIKTN